MKKSSGRMLGLAIGALAVGLACGWYAIHAASIFDPRRKWDREFEQRSWASTPQEERYVFINDLVDKKLLIGKSRAEVISLLGEPRAGDVASCDYLVDEGVWDPIVLRIEFDADRVVRVTIRGT